MNSDDHWVILGANTCPWCDRVKKLLDTYRIKYRYFHLDWNPDYPLKEFVKACGLTTVPQVYLNGNRIGGYEAVESYLLSIHGDPNQKGFFD